MIRAVHVPYTVAQRERRVVRIAAVMTDGLRRG
jgi:hypothetical protein